MCLALVIAAWTVVRLFSVTAAIVMSAVAMAVPPIAVIFVNAGDESGRRLQRSAGRAYGGNRQR